MAAEHAIFFRRATHALFITAGLLVLARFTSLRTFVPAESAHATALVATLALGCSIGLAEVAGWKLVIPILTAGAGAAVAITIAVALHRVGRARTIKLDIKEVSRG